MIEYIIPTNPDDRILKKASDLLKESGVIAFPTDTNWVLTCDPFSRKGLENMHRLKGEGKAKHFSVLASTVSMATEVAHISDYAYRLLRNKIPGHYTFIFHASKKMTKAVKASKTDKEVGIRFVPDVFTNTFVEFYGGVLASTNITNELIGCNEGDEIYSYLIEESIGNKVNLILDPGEYDFVGPSSIINLVDDEIELIREGSGDVGVFGL